MQVGRTVPSVSATTVIYYLAHALVISIGVAVTLVGGVVWTAVGTSLIATGGAGAVIYVYLARTEATREALEMLSSFGLTRIYDRRAAQIRSEYASRLSVATSNIDIIGFGLKDFRRDYIAELGALSAKANIRILLIDPATELARLRDGEEHQSAGTIAREVEEFITQYSQLYGASPPPKLALRLYTCLPSVNIFRIDNDIFWGPYFVGRASGNTATFRVRRGGTLYDQLLQHFEEIWDHHSKPITSAP
jgi:hypothetical protein